MRRQHTGRPGTTVIPADWATAPAAIVARALPSTVRIGTPATQPKWNEGRGQSESGGLVAVYTGPASIMAVSDTARAATVVEDPVTTRVYDITLALSRPGADTVGAGHTVIVDACDDAALVGRRLEVQDAERGSRRFSRVLLATLLD